MELKEIEKSIIKKYRGKLFAPFIRGIQEYEMLKEGDCVGVCISGGKDSLLLAKLFEELQKHSDFPFTVKYLVMDPGFRDENAKALKENLEILGIDAIIKKSDIFEVADKVGGEKPCYMCARMRRGFLYKFAQEQGCNKIALGHHFDDVVETILINMLYGAQFNTMMPKLKSSNFPGMELIRPMIYIKEKDIINWVKFSEIHPMKCACKVASGDVESKRSEVKELIKELKKKYDDVDKNIYKSAENVNLNCCLGWKKKDQYTSFLDEYDSLDSSDE